MQRRSRDHCVSEKGRMKGRCCLWRVPAILGLASALRTGRVEGCQAQGRYPWELLSPAQGPSPPPESDGWTMARNVLAPLPASPSRPTSAFPPLGRSLPPTPATHIHTHTALARGAGDHYLLIEEGWCQSSGTGVVALGLAHLGSNPKSATYKLGDLWQVAETLFLSL